MFFKSDFKSVKKFDEQTWIIFFPKILKKYIFFFTQKYLNTPKNAPMSTMQ